jgi:hypothetical protein
MRKRLIKANVRSIDYHEFAIRHEMSIEAPQLLLCRNTGFTYPRPHYYLTL